MLLFGFFYPVPSLFYWSLLCFSHFSCSSFTFPPPPVPPFSFPHLFLFLLFLFIVIHILPFLFILLLSPYLFSFSSSLLSLSSYFSFALFSGNFQSRSCVFFLQDSALPQPLFLSTAGSRWSFSREANGCATLCPPRPESKPQHPQSLAPSN